MFTKNAFKFICNSNGITDEQVIDKLYKVKMAGTAEWYKNLFEKGLGKDVMDVYNQFKGAIGGSDTLANLTLGGGLGGLAGYLHSGKEGILPGALTGGVGGVVGGHILKGLANPKDPFKIAIPTGPNNKTEEVSLENEFFTGPLAAKRSQAATGAEYTQEAKGKIWALENFAAAEVEKRKNIAKELASKAWKEQYQGTEPKEEHSNYKQMLQNAKSQDQFLNWWEDYQGIK